MIKKEKTQHPISIEIQTFRESQLSLQLASIDENAFPHSSYAPFVYHDLCYFILISDLAKHGQNLKYNKKVGIALIEDEKETKDIFARRRLTYTAQAKLIPREDELWQSILNKLKVHAGDTTDILQQLQDFHLYCLQPLEGRYVKGFAKAYAIDAKELPTISALDKNSHQPRAAASSKSEKPV